MKVVLKQKSGVYLVNIYNIVEKHKFTPNTNLQQLQQAGQMFRLRKNYGIKTVL